jgi:hypothetical protein
LPKSKVGKAALVFSINYPILCRGIDASLEYIDSEIEAARKLRDQLVDLKESIIKDKKWKK